MLIRAINKSLPFNSKALGQRHSNLFAFSSSIPYKFGGIAFQKDFKSHNANAKAQKYFGPQILNKLSNTYLVALQALATQNKKILGNLLQQNLIDQIKKDKNSKQVIRLIGSRKFEEIEVGRISVIVNCSFDRSKNLSISKFYKLSKIYQFAQANSLQRSQGFSLNKKFKSLICLYITFKSDNKLIKVVKNQKQIQKLEDNNLQIHSMQFQTEMNFSINQAIQLVNLLFKAKVLRKKPLNYVQFCQKFDSNWRIGDIDGILNGNQTIPQISK